MNKLSQDYQLELAHYDTCLPDYFGGHTTPYLQVLAYPMTYKALRDSLLSELNEIVCGDLSELPEQLRDGDYDLSELGYAKIRAAINRLKPAVKNAKRCFTDIEISEDDDCCDSVYAYFLIREI